MPGENPTNTGGGGTVSSVAGRTGDITLALSDIADAGSAAALDAGTDAGELVVVQAGGKLPPLDGSDLTGVVASAVLTSSALRRAYWQAVVNSTATLQFYGVATPTELANTNAALVDATGAYKAQTSAGTANNDAGNQIATLAWRDWLPDISYAFKTGPDITACRLWVGLTSVPNTLKTVSDPTGASLPTAAFRYATDVDGTLFWRVITSNGTTNNADDTTTVAIAPDTPYVLRVQATDASTIVDSINGAVVKTHTSQLPALGTMLGSICLVRTLENAAKVMRFSRADVLYAV